MTIYDPTRRADQAPRMLCLTCLNEFTLGVDGTEDGCDRCTGAVRATNGFVIDQPQCTGLDPVRCDDDKCPVHGSSYAQR